MLLNNAMSYHINGKDVKELWFGGNKVWEMAALSATLNGTGGFTGKTWEEVQAIVASGAAQDHFALGDRVTIQLQTPLNMNEAQNAENTVTELTLEVCAFNAMSTTNTMMLNVDNTDCYNTFYMAMHATSTKANWASSSNQLRIAINSTFYNALPADLQNIIVETTHIYTKYNSSATTNTITEKIMLPSDRYDTKPYTPASSPTMDGYGTSSTSTQYKYIEYENGTFDGYAFSNAAERFIPMFNIG